MSIVNKEILEQAKVEGKFFDLRTGEIVDEPVEYGRYPIREINPDLLKSMYDQFMSGALYPQYYHKVLCLPKHGIRNYLRSCGPILSSKETKQIYREEVNQQHIETCQERYQVDNPSQLEWVKRKKEDTHESKTGYKYSMQNPEERANFIQTMLEEHGVENPSQLEWVKRKKEATYEDKTGYKYTFLNPEKRAEISQALFEEHGVVNVSQLEWVKEKKANSFLKSCGETNIFKTQEFKDDLFELRKSKDPRYAKVWEYKEILENTKPSPELVEEIYQFLEDEYGESQYIVWSRFLELPKRKFSKPEIAMKNILESIPVDFKDHVFGYQGMLNKKGNMFELDFLVGYKLAIEVNGLFRHSVDGPYIKEVIKTLIDPDFHFHKFKECHIRGITLISFTDIEIYEFPDFVRDVVRFHLGEIDEVGIPEDLIERLNFKDLNEIDSSRCYCLTPTKELESIELRERVIDGFTYIDAGFQK